jgi:hypothetical protein
VLIYNHDPFSFIGPYADDLSVDALDPSILNFGPQGEIDSTAYDPLNVGEHAPTMTPLEGEWTGRCFSNGPRDSQGLMEIFIATVAMDGTFYGRGRDYHGAFDIHGSVRESDVKMTFVREKTNHLDNENVPAAYEGTLDMGQTAIAGSWSTYKYRNVGEINLLPISASVYRSRYSAQTFVANQARARWSFALDAVLYDVRRRLWSWSFFKTRLAERQRFIKLYYCWYFANDYNCLNEAEKAELKNLECSLSPADVQYYRSISRSQFKPCLHVLVTYPLLLPCFQC